MLVAGIDSFHLPIVSPALPLCNSLGRKPEAGNCIASAARRVPQGSASCGEERPSSRTKGPRRLRAQHAPRILASAVHSSPDITKRILPPGTPMPDPRSRRGMAGSMAAGRPEDVRWTRFSRSAWQQSETPRDMPAALKRESIFRGLHGPGGIGDSVHMFTYLFVYPLSAEPL